MNSTEMLGTIKNHSILDNKPHISKEMLSVLLEVGSVIIHVYGS